MSGLVVRSAKKFFREVRSPGDAAKFCWRMVMPVDPHLRMGHGWLWGNLQRMELSQIIPGIESSSVLIVDAFRPNLQATPMVEEIAALLAILRHTGAKKVFELGTFDGSTTVNIAANTPDDAEIVTLDLPPNWDGKLVFELPEVFRNVPDTRIVGRQFRNTPYAGKIQQVLGDSAAIDWSALPGPFDLIFIDACHHYDYVKKDTENALKHITPKGVIVWHDYGSYKGVSDAVDEAAAKFKVHAIAGTRMAVGFPAMKPSV